jgi:hypothetical protein
MTDQRKYALQDKKMIIFLERARIALETAQNELDEAYRNVKQVEVALERRFREEPDNEQS